MESAIKAVGGSQVHGVMGKSVPQGVGLISVYL